MTILGTILPRTGAILPTTRAPTQPHASRQRTSWSSTVTGFGSARTIATHGGSPPRFAMSQQAIKAHGPQMASITMPISAMTRRTSCGHGAARRARRARRKITRKITQNYAKLRRHYAKKYTCFTQISYAGITQILRKIRTSYANKLRRHYAIFTHKLRKDDYAQYAGITQICLCINYAYFQFLRNYI